MSQKIRFPLSIKYESINDSKKVVAVSKYLPSVDRVTLRGSPLGPW